MKKELFVESVEAIDKQLQHDVAMSEKLAEVFPNTFAPNLMPQNHWLQNALIEVLCVTMCDIDKGLDGHSWIEYFCWELDFGRRNNELKVTGADGYEIPMSNAGELWEYLNSKNNPSSQGKG